WLWRHGGSLRGGRPPTGPARGPQSAAAAFGRGAFGAATVFARSARGGGTGARSRRHHILCRRRGHFALLYHALASRRTAGNAPATCGGAAGARSAPHRGGNGGRLGGGACPGVNPPRHQTGQPMVGRGAGTRENIGLWF